MLFSTVIKYLPPWGRSHFSVLGMTGSYAVFPNLHQSCSIPFFCTCPAFSYAVLISHSQITVCVRASLSIFHPCATGVLSAVQTCFGHSNRSEVVEMRRARDEQRRFHDPPCRTDFRHVGVPAISTIDITSTVQQNIYIVKLQRNLSCIGI